MRRIVCSRQTCRSQHTFTPGLEFYLAQRVRCVVYTTDVHSVFALCVQDVPLSEEVFKRTWFGRANRITNVVLRRKLGRPWSREKPRARILVRDACFLQVHPRTVIRQAPAHAGNRDGDRPRSIETEEPHARVCPLVMHVRAHVEFVEVRDAWYRR